MPTTDITKEFTDMPTTDITKEFTDMPTPTGWFSRTTLTLAVAVVIGLLLSVTGMTARADSAAAAEPTQLYLPYPATVTWRVSQGNGGGTSHFCTGKKVQDCYAYDFDLNVDQPILTAAPGKVLQIQRDVQGQSLIGGGYGNFVVLQHPDGTCTRYGHMKAGTVPNLAIGTPIDQGIQIGVVGNTGRTLPLGSGQHLHFARENCSTGLSIPTGFVETGGARLSEKGSYTSHNDGCRVACSITSLANGKFVSAEISRSGDGYGTLRARGDRVGGWERFQLSGDCRSASGCSITSLANGKFVSAEISRSGDGYGTLRARGDRVGGWERFQLSGDCRSSCAFVSVANGKFVSAEISRSGDGYGEMRARSDRVGGWERFRLNK